MSVCDVPAMEWRPFLERFSRAHRAWLATTHYVSADVALAGTRSAPLGSVTLDERPSGASVRVVFLDGLSYRVERPHAVRIDRTDAGAERAIEIEARDGALLRVAFRATALPEELDGLAPAEVYSLEPSR